MADEDMKAWRFERLKHALQALAAPAEIQFSLFPDFVTKTDELALEFDNFARAVLANDCEELGSQKAARLEELDRHLGSSDNDVWTDDALRKHPFWAEARVLAIDALNVFGWPIEDPPSYRHEYIPATPGR